MEYWTPEAKFAWLAAMVDGEGTIGLYDVVMTHNTNKRGWSCKMRIYNSNRKVLDKAKEICGCGNIYLHMDNESKFNGWKDEFQFCISAKNMELVLPKLIPYLIIKRPVATLVLEALPLLRRRRMHYHDDGADKHLKELSLAMMKLNHAGVKSS